MATRSFPSLEAALAAGFTVDLGNGEYAEGGEMLPRERYAELFKAIGGGALPVPPGDTFKLPDHREFLRRYGAQPEKGDDDGKRKTED